MPTSQRSLSLGYSGYFLSAITQERLSRQQEHVNCNCNTTRVKKCILSSDVSKRGLCYLCRWSIQHTLGAAQKKKRTGGRTRSTYQIQGQRAKHRLPSHFLFWPAIAFTNCTTLKCALDYFVLPGC